jgi:transposase
MDQSNSPSSSVDGSTFQYVVGIDIGSQTCSLCGLKFDKSQLIKPTEFANDPTGFAHLLTKVEQLGVPPDQILIGLEATSRDARKSVSFSPRAGISTVSAAPTPNASVCSTTRLASENGPLGCDDHCSCVTRDGEARRGYVPTELIATYRELVRLHSQLSDEVARYKNEIHARLLVLFPEFSQVFADPTRPTALALLKQYPSAQAMAAAGVETIAARVARIGSTQLWA